ncbi:ArsR/SmtB family transcription factor [Curvivirga sp.]|uniref:ArsR/SmtB family transcription factor n=1 Tax=Curvivirga sp. TaxID=2856848 RepID=UPI003B59AA39
MDELLEALKAIAEPTRFRILVLCAHGELTVSELVDILGQSQPRVSRHLRLMVEAGVLQRQQEGSWAWYRATGDASSLAAGRRTNQSLATLVEQITDLVPLDDPIITKDLERLDRIKETRDQKAAEYFAVNASEWDKIRSLHVDEAEVEAALIKAFDKHDMGHFLDIGTGTGRILSVLSDKVEAAVGVDTSGQMLAIARSALAKTELDKCQVRQADMYNLPFEKAAFNSACFHMVLHYASDPEAAIREASRVLAPGGRIVIVDFAPHSNEELRKKHAHLWSGFSNDEITRWCENAGLSLNAPINFEDGPLTVCLWTADLPANINSIEEVA